MFGSNCYFLTCIQVSQEIGKGVWYSHLFKNFLQFVVIHTVKGISIISEAEVDVYLEFPCLLYDATNVVYLLSSSSAFSKPRLCTWKFSVHIILKPSLKDFEHNLTSMWNECKCMVLWTSFGTALLWDWNENTFSSPLATAVFRICCYILCNSFTASSFRIWNSSGRIPSPLLAWFPVMFPTRLHPPGYPALGEWPQHCGYQGHEDLFCIVLLCILVTSSYSLLLLLGPYCFCHFLCVSLHEIFPWYLQFSWRDL